MTEKEINEALKLIKEPITVNSIEYKYFDQENYEKLLSVYENCRWFVDNYEQVLQNIKNLQQELQRKDNIINGIKQEIERLLERQYASERFAKENGFNTYLPAKVNLEFLKNKINELEGDNK